MGAIRCPTRRSSRPSCLRFATARRRLSLGVITLEDIELVETEEIHYRACQALVALFRDQVEAKLDCVHTRIFNYVLHPESKYVNCGISPEVKNGGPPHPEHVVPCAVLINESFRLIKEKKKSDDEIAKLLQRHWKIATISKAEAKILDSDLGLKSRMPEGWRFEDGDTLARLKLAGITIDAKES